MYSNLKQTALKKALFIFAGAVIFSTTQASTVVPPPLPTGSHMVRQHAGVNNEEARRAKRAHHHKGHFKKDVTRDDTIDDVSEENSTKQGNGKNIAKPKSK
jgi:hypothetical protein